MACFPLSPLELICHFDRVPLTATWPPSATTTDLYVYKLPVFLLLVANTFFLVWIMVDVANLTDMELSTLSGHTAVLLCMTMHDGMYYDTTSNSQIVLTFKNLGMLSFPMAFCYCIHSVTYNEHKSWYSFILDSCHGFLLTLGFIIMTYKLLTSY